MASCQLVGNLRFAAGAVRRGTSLVNAGATRWLTITFDVELNCPQPLPVQFKVSYAASGRVTTAPFDSFPDLSQVRYSAGALVVSLDDSGCG